MARPGGLCTPLGTLPQETTLLDLTPNDLKISAEKILELHPDPVPHFRLLRDVLHLDPTSADYCQAEKALQGSKWIALLHRSQWPDGTWGRFHTQDTRVKQPFITTEVAITTALDSGLDRHSPILQKVQNVLVDYADGKIYWPDPPEKHDNPLAWYVWMRQWSAAVLSQIDQRHPRLEEFWNIWAESVKASFHSGSYDRQKEIEALNSLLKCRMKNPVPFHNKYPLLILSATDIPKTILQFSAFGELETAAKPPDRLHGGDTLIVVEGLRWVIAGWVKGITRGKW